MKWIVWTILRISRMLNQFAVEISTLPVDQCHSHLIQYQKGCWGLLSYRRAAKKGRQASGTHMENRETFLQIHMEKNERPEQNRDLRCQSGPSAKDSVIFSVRHSSNNYGADLQRLQISDLHFDKYPTPATFAFLEIRFKTEVCTCSQFPTEAVQWIKKWSWLIQWMN